MTLLLSALLPLRECLESPHHDIDAPVAFPREPEPKQTTCPILRANRGARTPEETPEIAVTEIVTETVIETAIATGTVPAGVEMVTVTASNQGAGAPVDDAPGANRNRFR